jgi:hypothetical protein
MFMWLLRIPAFRRRVMDLRPHDRLYHPLRRLVEFQYGCAYPYDPTWDALLSTMLEMDMYGMGEHPGIYTLRVGDYLVWCENFPYACGEIIGAFSPPSAFRNLRPSVFTMLRLIEAHRLTMSETTKGEPK